LLTKKEKEREERKRGVIESIIGITFICRVVLSRLFVVQFVVVLLYFLVVIFFGLFESIDETAI